MKITAQERAIAIKATKTLGLNVAGVDILRADRGPLVMKLMLHGLEGIETTTGFDIAGMMIEFIEQNTQRRFATSASISKS